MRKSLIILVILGILAPQWRTVAQDCADFDNAVEYSLRAETAFDQRLYEDSILDYTCAIGFDDTSASYYNGRGSAYYYLKQDASARADFIKALELDPEGGYIYNNLANLYYDIGDYDQALEYYLIASEKDNPTSVIFTNLAYLYIEIGEYDKAQTALDEAFNNPIYQTPTTYLAQAYLNTIVYPAVPEMAALSYYDWLLRVGTIRKTPQYVLNRSYETRIRDGDMEYITLNLQEGDILNVSAGITDKNQNTDPLLILLDDQEYPLIADDDSGVNFNAVISNYVAPYTGTYTLVLTHSEGFYFTGTDGLVNLSLQVKRDGTAVTESAPPPSTDSTAPSTDSTAPSTETPLEGTEIKVGAFASYKLFPNETAEVNTTEGDRLNLRSGPGLRFEIVTKLEDATKVTLLEGPRKQDGLAWWLLRTPDGIEGWAVERVDEDQTLQIALLVGEEAVVVTGDERLNMRVEPGRGAERVAQLVDGTRLTLLEAPRNADGYRWWRVRTADGIEGWIVDQIDGERTIMPAKEYDS